MYHLLPVKIHCLGMEHVFLDKSLSAVSHNMVPLYFYPRLCNETARVNPNTSFFHRQVQFKMYIIKILLVRHFSLGMSCYPRLFFIHLRFFSLAAVNGSVLSACMLIMSQITATFEFGVTVSPERALQFTKYTCSSSSFLKSFSLVTWKR